MEILFSNIFSVTFCSFELGVSIILSFLALLLVDAIILSY
jgi:hypothetical protein